MKAYKAAREYRHHEIKFEVGNTYTFHGNLDPNEHGLNYYKITRYTFCACQWRNYFKLLEVEVLGEFINNDKESEGSKLHNSVTDKMKITRVVPKEEFPILMGLTLNDNGDILKRTGDYYDWEWKYEYDENYNLIKEINPQFGISTYEYDGNNNKVKVTWGNGHIWTYEYDEKNRKVKEINENGETIGFWVYDDNNNVIIDKLNYRKTRFYDYDDENRLVRESTFSSILDGKGWSWEYDENGNLIKQTYPQGRVYLYGYDENNNMTTEVSPSGVIKAYEYDHNKNRIKQVLPKEKAWEIVIT